MLLTSILLSLAAPLQAPALAEAPAEAPIEVSETNRELVRELTVDGGRVEREARIDETGARVADGRYQEWDRNGALRVEGQYEGDVRTGEWRTYHPNGAVESAGSYVDGQPEGRWTEFYESGERRARGAYRHGTRNAHWRFYDPVGGLVVRDSGPYVAEIEYHPNGRIAMAGEKLFERQHGRWRWWSAAGRLLCEANYDRDELQGAWRSYWPVDGSLCLAGEYDRGERAGAWAFWHQDGSFDARMLSGQFNLGRRIGNLMSAPTFVGEDRRRLGQPVPLSSLPRPSPAPGTLTTDRIRLETLVESFRSISAEDRETRVESLVLRRQEAVPAVLTTLRFLDFSDPADADFAAYLNSVLTRIHGGHSFGWRAGTSPDAVVHNQSQTLRWTSLWELTRGNPAFLTDLAETQPGRAPSTELLHPAVPEPVRIPDAAPGFAYRLPIGARARRLQDAGGAGIEATLDAALATLAARQDSDGSWPPTAEHPTFRTAVTASALFALVGAGHAEPGATYTAPVHAAAAWLFERQVDPDGMAPGQIGVFDDDTSVAPEALDAQLGHAVATLALCEYALASGDDGHRAELALALERVRELRTPDGTWASSEPYPDALLTAWMISALHAGERAGVERLDTASPELARTTLAALSRATDPLTGRVADGAPTATAATLLTRFQLGQLPEDVPLMQLAAEHLLAELPDTPDHVPSVDAWFFGSHALFQVGGSRWRQWAAAQRTALPKLLRAPTTEAADGAEATAAQLGTWNSDDIWGRRGGDVGAAALGALALEVYWRLPRTPR